MQGVVIDERVVVDDEPQARGAQAHLPDVGASAEGPQHGVRQRLLVVHRGGAPPAQCLLDFIGHLLREGPDDDLDASGRRADDASRAERLECPLVHAGVVGHGEPQPRRAGVDVLEVGRAPERLHVRGATAQGRSGEAEPSGAVLLGGQGLFLLAAQRLQVEPGDAEAEHPVVGGRVDRADGQQEDGVRRLVVVQHVVEQAGREPEAELHVQHVHDDVRHARQHRVEQVERRREEHEGELDRLGDARQEGRQRDGRQHAAHPGAVLLRRGVVHGEAGRRQAKHHDREEARHCGARGRVSREEALQVARHTVEVAQDEPGDVVEDVVQARDDQQPVEEAVQEEAELAGGEHVAAEAIEARLDAGPAQAKQGREHQAGEAGDDGDEPAAAEEREVLRQLDVLVAVVQQAGHEAGKDAGRHADLRQELGLVAGDGQIPRRPGQLSQHLGGHAHDGFGALDGDEEAHGAGEPRGAMVLAREAHRHTHGEQQAEVGEDGVARGGHEGNVQQVPLAKPQQEACDGKDCDGQHQGTPELLDSSELIGLHAPLSGEGGVPLLGLPFTRDECSHLVTGCEFQRLPRGFLALRQGERADEGLESRDDGGGGRQLRDPQADEQRGCLGIRGNASAYRHRAAVLAGPLHRLRHQAEDAGVQAVELGRQVRVAAVHRQCVLGEIIRADGEEVGLGRQPVRQDGGGGDFNHGAHVNRGGDAQLSALRLHHGPHGLQLVRGGDHRNEDAADPQGLHPEDGADLRAQQLGVAQGDAHAPQAEHRVLLGGQRQVRQGLVAADIERADDQGTVLEGVGDLLVLGRLLVFGGRGEPLQEEELAAQQATTLGPLCGRRRRVSWPAEVGEDLDADAVRRVARLMGCRQVRLSAGGPGTQGAQGGLPRCLGRMDVKLSPVPIDDQ
ncbi:hypothetical protein STIAU_7384 [Stigmatella aurantiaca DW4/3-1]|uniref:Uncharacterized protein n=1 Tax=Stigmatella aurantiaca (strain DW4/3-1) TaxID=378806 RepID=Q099V3_STIAD|nr:hypothetical protein STIAU_7384 [Stigmatella aurantiaca DW4/3-1]